MKISCTVEISRRDLPPTCKRRDTKSLATLVLSSRTFKTVHRDKDVLLYVCTPNYKDKYKVYNNVEKMFTKFMCEGKATVRFKVPPHDILINKADPLELKGFLGGVGLTITGKGAGKFQLSSPTTEVKRPKEKIEILKPADLPGRAGFPSNVTSLHILSCGLRRIDKEILKLQNLTSLNLAHNNIKELPLALADFRLTELFLQQNELTLFPSQLAEGDLGQTLAILDLSFNRIVELSPNFCLMKKITNLRLNNNKLLKLPRNIQLLESLRIFNASHNELKVLPFGIRKLHLDTLDLFSNPLNTDVVLRPLTLWELPSLKELSASAILEYEFKFSPEDLPKRLIDYIIDHCPCPCGKKVFQTASSCILVLDLYKLASTVVYINNSSRFKVPLEVYFCSTKCWKKAIGR